MINPAVQTAPNDQQSQPAPSVQQSQSVPPRKEVEKRHMDAEGFTIPPKHLIRRVTSTPCYHFYSATRLLKARTQPHSSTRVNSALSYAQIVNNQPAALRQPTDSSPDGSGLQSARNIIRFSSRTVQGFLLNSHTTKRFISPLSSGQ
ncbi:hypothetical protein CEXT_764721 [Caerostris extrusa]|uniref:Uncharacterized protein n=1 Tax=Caerostris extrusa TaxID=172846 RepID=A0AAV4VJE0_CAEEX|nr:hypothetical protein CEXT_764721 [Caerostris extrusa]